MVGICGLVNQVSITPSYSFTFNLISGLMVCKRLKAFLQIKHNFLKGKILPECLVQIYLVMKLRFSDMQVFAVCCLY